MTATASRRDFNVFWLGQALSALGDAFAFIAVPLLVLDATGSVAQMGLVTATSGAAAVTAGLFSGLAMDRVDRRRLMILCDLGRAVLYALIPLGWALVGPRLGLVYVVTALASALGSLFSVGYVTAIPNLVGPERVTEANGRLTASHGVCFVVGPALAGLVSARLGSTAAVGVDAVSFLASALSLASIRFGRARAAAPAGDRGRGDALAGVRFLFRHPVLRAVTVYFAALSILDAGVLDLLVFLLKRRFAQGDGGVGFAMAVGSAGAVVGGLVAAAGRRRFGFGTCFLGACAVQGLAVAALGVAPAVAVVVAFAMLWSAAITLRGVVTMSLRQQITPDHLLGRVTAAFWTLGGATGPLGAALGTWVAERAGVRPVLLTMGALLWVTTALGALTPLRLARPEALTAREAEGEPESRAAV